MGKYLSSLLTSKLTQKSMHKMGSTRCGSRSEKMSIPDLKQVGAKRKKELVVVKSSNWLNNSPTAEAEAEAADLGFPSRSCCCCCCCCHTTHTFRLIGRGLERAQLSSAQLSCGSNFPFSISSSSTCSNFASNQQPHTFTKREKRELLNTRSNNPFFRRYLYGSFFQWVDPVFLINRWNDPSFRYVYTVWRVPPLAFLTPYFLYLFMTFFLPLLLVSSEHDMLMMSEAIERPTGKLLHLIWSGLVWSGLA